MGSEWANSELGSFIRLQRGHDLTDSQRKPGNVPVMGSAGQNGFHDTSKAKGPGIVLGRSGASFGKVHYTPNDYWPHNTALYVTDFQGNDELFTYYFLKTIDFSSYNTGSAQPSLNRNHLYSIPVNIPPLPEQKAIAHTLGTLDDKIELNRRMNATLEGMAQALFKSWFVDFDPVIDNALAAGNPIPDELAPRTEVRKKALAKNSKIHYSPVTTHHSKFPAAFQFTEELGWIPEGWDVKQLDEQIKLIGGGTPKTSVEEYWNGSIPWFSVVDAPNDSDVFVIDTEKKISEIGLKNSSTKTLRAGTTIISARGTVGRCALVGVEMTMNQSCYGVQGADGASDIYTYYSIRHYVSDLQQRGHGSVFNTITRDTFRSIKIPFGAANLTCAFEAQLSDQLARVKANLYEQATLTKLRDTLLPKLISGDLRTLKTQSEKVNA